MNYKEFINDGIKFKYLFRYLFLFLFFILINGELYADRSLSSHKISVVIKNQSLASVFKKVKEQTGFNILYNDKLVEVVKNVSIQANNMPLNTFLSKVLSEIDLTYSVSDKNILIHKESISKISGSNTLQTKISGQVKDGDGKTLAGVSIGIKGGANKAKTDDNGKFEIAASLGEILVFKIVGFVEKEVSIKSTNIGVIVLTADELNLEEVVVTALGIKRDEKAIGYAQQTINAEQLSTAVSPNWSDGLKGKVAGLNIISGGTGPINSQSIQLRGATSLDPSSNYALIVIDGVPMNQESIAYGNNVGAAYGTDAPVDYGNAISELRQEDIESVSVLKGPSAAALYGSRAANGALIITTKSGKKNQKLGISYNSSLNLDQVTNWPDYQYEYGSGSMNARDANGNQYYSWGNSVDGPSTNTPEAYGPKFDGQYFFQYDPLTQEQGKERTLWQPYKNNMKDFFRLGNTFENAVSFQGGDEKGSMRLNISHTNNNYITPNSGYERNAVSFNGNYEISRAIRVSAGVNYNNRSSENLPAFGISNGSLGYFLMFLMPSVDIDWYKPVWHKGKENIEQLNPFSNWSSNPYYILNVDVNPLQSNQIVGNTKVDIKLNSKWDLMGRVTMNSLNQLRETHRGYSSKKYPKGYYGRQDVNSQEFNFDFLTTYKDSFLDNFHYSIMGGGSRMQYEMKNVMSSVDALVVPTVFTLANGMNNPLTKTNDANKQINSLYGMGSINWNEKIFLDFTGRNDWSSSLPSNNNSYFYPSISSSFIVSDLIDLPSQISYLKYRASFAKVGADADPYQTSLYYSQSGFPSSAVVPNALFNANLKPEITKSIETGFDLKFLRNRLGVDLTYYNSVTKNQILALPSDIVGGYSNRVINAGEVRNRGWELIVNANPISREKFDWKIIANWSTNDNTILSLTDNLERQTLAQVWQAYLIAKVGGSTTDLYGSTFVRDPEGNMVYKNGVPVRDNSQSLLGNTSPDWKAGLTNTFVYNNIRLSFTIDGQVGGSLFSGTYNRASWAGTLANTLPGREEGTILGEGVVLNTDGSYSPNTTRVNTQTYYSELHQTAEAGVFKGTFFKFRELTLGYNVPKRYLERYKINGLSVSLFGRNLAVFSNYPMFDPEAGTKNGAVFVPGIEITPMPHTSSYGFNFKIDF